VHDDPGLRPSEVERRCITYLLMITLVLPRVIFSGTLTDGAAILLTWSTLGLLLTRRASYRIPRATVWRPRDTRLRRWGVALFERLGRVPIANGIRGTLPWNPYLLAPPAKSSDPADTPIARDLGEDLSARTTRAIPS
jgi:hypothetical protein